MTASVIAAIQEPDPSETGLFDKPPTPRSRAYRLLESDYTWVVPMSLDEAPGIHSCCMIQDVRDRRQFDRLVSCGSNHRPVERNGSKVVELASG